MKKNEIDKVFVQMYAEILKATTGMVVNMKKNLEPELVINECYITLVKHGERLKDQKDVKRFLLKCLRDSIGWKNSKVNRQEAIRHTYMTDAELANVAGAEDWGVFYDKVEDYEVETSVRVLAEDYRAQQNNEIMLWFLDAYLAGKTCRQIAEELNVSKDSAYRMTEKVKEDIRIFAESKGVII